MKPLQFSYFRWVGFRNHVRIGSWLASVWFRRSRVLFAFFCALFVALIALFIQVPTVSPSVARLLEAILPIALFLLLLVAKWSRRPPPNDGGPRGPALGRPVPDDRGPRHHLIAAKALPPSKKTYLFQKD